MGDDFNRKYGPWALVAGSVLGIGRAFCREILQRGMPLIAVDVREPDLRALAESARAAGGEVDPIVVDLARDDAADRLVAAIAGREIGLLVYCAAHIPAGRFVDEPADSVARALAVNARTPLLLTHAIAKSMRARKRGGIILVSSMAALQGTGWVATYAGTKAFEMILAESLWWELRGDGVDVLAILPGATDTEGLHRASPFIQDPSALAKPEDVAAEALQFLGKGPSLVCGETNRALAEAMRSLPREQAIDMMSSGTRLMAEGPTKKG
jgi:short-subunit dehydrogenase